jgi:hypothetical protein
MSAIIEQLKAEKGHLEVELAGVEPKRKRLGLINELLRSYGEQPEQETLPLNTAPSSNPKFAKTGLTDSVVEFFKAHPHEQFTPREVGDQLKAAGFKAIAKNFVVMIKNTCVRKSTGPDAILDRVTKAGFAAFVLR